jgi:Holliday junction resolvase RusA-like endonuclease
MWKLKSIKPKVPLESCQIYCKFFFSNNRQRDMSNVFESIADILVDAEIIKDDTWQVVELVHLASYGIDKENPRVEVQVI